MYKHILLAYDFDNDFDKIPDALAHLVQPDDDVTITIFNVISELTLQTSVKYDDTHIDELKRKREHELQHFVNQLHERHLNTDIIIRAGAVVDLLLDEAHQGDYDVIVMSNKRPKPTLKNILGNVTHIVANRAEIPVLIIK